MEVNIKTKFKVKNTVFFNEEKIFILKIGIYVNVNEDCEIWYYCRLKDGGLEWFHESELSENYNFN